MADSLSGSQHSEKGHDLNLVCLSVLLRGGHIKIEGVHPLLPRPADIAWVAGLARSEEA